MDYGQPERAERLAAEYALGTLRGGARRRYERLLPAHPALAAALADWLARLRLLAGPVQPVEPPARVWAAVQARLFGASTAAAPEAPRGLARWFGSLGLWRSVGAVATAMTVVLAVMVVRPVPPAAPVVVVLQATSAGSALLQAGFVASVSADGRALVLRPLGPVQVEAAHALELWAVPREGAPRSLGLVRAGDGATTVLQVGLLDGTTAFAVSLEPAGGSPTGAPTGPVVSAGHV